MVLRTVEKNRSQSTPLSLKKFLSPLCVLCVGSVRLQSTRVVLRTVEKNRSQSTPLSLKKFLSPRKQFNFMACCFFIFIAHNHISSHVILPGLADHLFIFIAHISSHVILPGLADHLFIFIAHISSHVILPGLADHLTTAQFPKESPALSSLFLHK